MKILRELWASSPFWVVGDQIRARTKERRADNERLLAATRALKPDEIAAAYRPGLTQKMLDAVDWGEPWPSLRLIEDERERIADYLEPIFRDAGFPVDSRVRLVRFWTEKTWTLLQGTVHKKVFRALNLPPFFDAHRDPFGLIAFEKVRRHTDRFGRAEYIGFASAWTWGSAIPQFDEGGGS